MRPLDIHAIDMGEAVTPSEVASAAYVLSVVLRDAVAEALAVPGATVGGPVRGYDSRAGRQLLTAGCGVVWWWTARDRLEGL